MGSRRSAGRARRADGGRMDAKMVMEGSQMWWCSLVISVVGSEAMVEEI